MNEKLKRHNEIHWHNGTMTMEWNGLTQRWCRRSHTLNGDWLYSGDKFGCDACARMTTECEDRDRILETEYQTLTEKEDHQPCHKPKICDIS